MYLPHGSCSINTLLLLLLLLKMQKKNYGQVDKPRELISPDGQQENQKILVLMVMAPDWFSITARINDHSGLKQHKFSRLVCSVVEC